MLTAYTLELILRTRKAGRLLPFMGPALRGVVKTRFKERVCRIPEPCRPPQCTGCRHLSDCPYGRLYETPAPPSELVSPDLRSGTPRLSLAPRFPTPSAATAAGQEAISPAGTLIPVRIVAADAGPEDLDALVAAVTAAGDGGPGFRPDGVTFDALQPAREPVVHRLDPAELPTLADGAVLPGAVRIELATPLIRTRKEKGQKAQTLTRLTFLDVFDASQSVIRTLLAVAGCRYRPDLFAMRNRAAEIPLLHDGFAVFVQRHRPDRHDAATGDRGQEEIRAVIGTGTYECVPAGFIPWLTWGGLLHTGRRRVAGFGGWRIVLEP